ncbi:MAG TPA: hypothetical protein VD864_15865 [Nocardioides sp.]|nr:hypothetical protein [Nocardioides sp.]
MDQQPVRRRARHALSDEEVRERLAALRRRQQAQVELDLRLLRRS